MSDCHEDFLRFNKSISLSKEERSKLLTSRNAVEKRIRNYLSSIKYYTPTFREQGSFAMNTIVRPISGRYDLDLGVYFEELKGNPKNWPTTETVHRHIANSVRGQTSIRPIDKGPCIRVIYKSPYQNNVDLAYHIDLPVYAYRTSLWTDEIKTVIGFKGEKQWSEYSSPADFEKWFENQSSLNSNDSNQLRRLVKYFKAWKSVQPKSPKIPDGMLLTVLMAKNYEPDERDDIAFYNTVVTFYNKIWWWFSVTKPTDPKNDLAEELSDLQKSNFKKRIKTLIDNGEKAIDSSKHEESIKLWKSVFKSRFVVPEKLVIR